MIGLWDTTGNEVVKALAAERRSAGGVASGLALTLVAVVDERQVREAEAAATIAASAHPCRLLIVVRADVSPAERTRLDAEIVVGGRLGPCEAVVLRMHGRLALHAESVVHAAARPGRTGGDLVAQRAAGAHRLRPARRRRRPPDHRRGAGRPTRWPRCTPGPRTTRPATPTWPGRRITPWRTLVAGAFDTGLGKVTAANDHRGARTPTRRAALMRRLAASRGSASTPTLEKAHESNRSCEAVSCRCEDGDTSR